MKAILNLVLFFIFLLLKIKNSRVKIELNNNEEKDNLYFYEKKYLLSILNFYKPKIILELGTHKGEVSNIILETINNIKDATLYSYDFYDNKFTGHYVNENLKRKYKLYLGEDKAEILLNKIKDIDLVVVNLTSLLINETPILLEIIPLLKRNGLICFHNISSHYNINRKRVLDVYFNGFRYKSKFCEKNCSIKAFKIKGNIKNYFLQNCKNLIGNWTYFPTISTINRIKKSLNKYYDKTCKIAIENLISSFNKTLPKKKTVTIYIYTHRDFKNKYPISPNYIILSPKPLKNNYNITVKVIENDNYTKKFKDSLAEAYGLYWIWKNENLTDYIGINHYRRYFKFWGNIPNLGENDAIISKKSGMRYSGFLNNKSLIFNHYLLECEKIIDEKFPQYSMNYDKMTYAYYKNMILLKKEDFIEYCKFVFGVLFELIKRKGFNNFEDIHEYNIKNKIKSYHDRILGELQERLTTIFFLTYLKDRKIIHYKIKSFIN